MDLDLGICQKALRLNPDLWFAAQIVSKVCRLEKSAFPIQSVDALIDACRDPGTEHCRLDGVTLTATNAREYVPLAFFPISDSDELLTKVYASLCWARSMHDSERKIDLHKSFVPSSKGA